MLSDIILPFSFSFIVNLDSACFLVFVWFSFSVRTYVYCVYYYSLLGSLSNDDGSGNVAKKNFARAAHFFCPFLCRCLARLQRKTSRNFLVTRFMEETSYVFLLTFFFHCRSFSPWWQLTFLIFSPPLQNFLSFLQQKMSPLFFLSRLNSFSR